MKSPEMSIFVGELLGVPRVALRGSVDDWHDLAIGGVLDAFYGQGFSSIVLDIAQTSFAKPRGLSGIIRVLSSIPEGLCVHVVASGRSENALRRAGFPPNVRLYCTTDEIARYLASPCGATPEERETHGQQGDDLTLAA